MENPGRPRTIGGDSITDVMQLDQLDEATRKLIADLKLTVVRQTI